MKSGPVGNHVMSPFLSESYRRLQDQDRCRVVRMITLHDHRDPKTFLPRSLGENLDVSLPALESMVTVVSLQDETVKITKLIEGQRSDLARVLNALLEPAGWWLMRLFFRGTERRCGNPRWITTEASDSVSDVAE